MVDSQTRPLVICDAGGTPIDVVLENDKGFRKSIETGTLGSLHQDTGRLLPYAQEAEASIEDHTTWYRAVLTGPGQFWFRANRTGTEQLTALAAPAERAIAGAEPRARDDAAEAARSAAESATAADVDPPGDHETPAGDQIGAVLSSLVDVIRARRREMPEGSYTTHLFSAGKEKIRKKVGEEAVELILASNRAELTSEAADLIYHLLVLLEVEGVSLDEVAGELKLR